MSKKEAILLISIVVVFIGGFYYYMKYIFKPAPKQPAEAMVANAGQQPVTPVDRQEWLLPDVLKEISGNVFIDSNHMACIQDRDGVIYIYNLQSKTIDDEIPFAEKGDYEGLAIVDSTLYVLRADGYLFEVQPQKGGKPVVKTYDLPLELENETESLCYDKAGEQLLIGVKEKDLIEKDKKGIYGFDLKTKKMSKEAIVYIEPAVNDDKEDKVSDNDEDGKGKKKKKGKQEIKPSGMAINPKSGELYILDGPSSRLIIADGFGKIKSKVQLDKKTFPQPEGICFSANGDLYISSEADKNGQGIIVRVAPDTIL